MPRLSSALLIFPLVLIAFLASLVSDHQDRRGPGANSCMSSTFLNTLHCLITSGNLGAMSRISPNLGALIQVSNLVKW